VQQEFKKKKKKPGGTDKNYEKPKSGLPDDVQSANFSMRYRCASLLDY
jgi:hypothetical protein